MTFNPSAPDTGPKGGYDLVPQGSHMARCARIIELGMQESQYGNHNKVVIAFSLPNVHIDIGGERKQRFMSNPFGINMSNNEASTMAEYTKALNPQATNLGEFLNRPCQVIVGHYKKRDGNMGDRIDGVAPLMAGIEVPELDTEPFWFQWDNPTLETWNMIPEFHQNLIKEALNYKGSKVEALVEQSLAGSEEY